MDGRGGSKLLVTYISAVPLPQVQRGTGNEISGFPQVSPAWGISGQTEVHPHPPPGQYQDLLDILPADRARH